MRTASASIASGIFATLSLASPAASVEGTYRNDMRTTLKVAKRGSAHHAVIDLAWPGCLGRVEGPARLVASEMTLRGEDKSVGEICVVRITFEGRTATLTESGGCLAFHGTRCAFQGAVRR